MTAGRWPTVIAGIWGLLIGLGAFTFQFARGFSYFSNDPDACGNCHVMNEFLDSWRKSSHQGRAVCNDCHTPHAAMSKLIAKSGNGWNHSVKFTRQNFAEPIRIRPPNAGRLQANCIRCHEALVGDIMRPAADGSAGDEVYCVTCHRGVGHGPP